MTGVHPSVVGRIALPFVRLAIVLMRIILLGCMGALVQGCGSLEVNGFALGYSAWPEGTVTTKDNRPFVLSTPDQKIRIVPGALNMTPVPPSVWYLSDKALARFWLRAEFFDITSGVTTLRIKLHSGELTEKGLQIFGAGHGLSANIIGNWKDQLVRTEEYTTSVTCTRKCTRDVEHETCDKGTCKKERFTETYDCGSGSRTQEIRDDHWLRHYEIGFMNPQKSTDTLAQFKATAPYSNKTILYTGECR